MRGASLEECDECCECPYRCEHSRSSSCLTVQPGGSAFRFASAPEQSPTSRQLQHEVFLASKAPVLGASPKHPAPSTFDQGNCTTPGCPTRAPSAQQGCVHRIRTCFVALKAEARTTSARSCVVVFVAFSFGGPSSRPFRQTLTVGFAEALEGLSRPAPGCSHIVRDPRQYLKAVSDLPCCSKKIFAGVALPHQRANDQMA